MNDLLKSLKSLAEESRLRLVALLLEGGERPVNELARILGQSQPRVSHHLKVLSDAAIVERYAEGAFVFYRISQGAAGLFAVHLLNEYGKDILSLLDRRALEDQMAQQNEIASGYFDQHAQEWDSLRAGQIDEAMINNQILSLIPKQTKINNALDIGTGTGAMLMLLAPFIVEGEGIDLSKPMLDLARARIGRMGHHHCLVRQGDMHRMTYLENSFDLVVMNMVLHFSDQPERALKEAARVLRPNGIMILADFAPHQREELRSHQSHRRLGFPQDELIAMVETCKLSLFSAQTIENEKQGKFLPVHLLGFKKNV